VNEIVDKVSRVDIPGDRVDFIIKADNPFYVEPQPAPKARNVVLVHGLFADGSSWSEVIARLQQKGIQVTAVQNPLTTLQ
jgi:alpha-beta hydrolase superfamily lysophospholipase